jgi:hypothetical protein
MPGAACAIVVPPDGIVLNIVTSWVLSQGFTCTTSQLVMVDKCGIYGIDDGKFRSRHITGSQWRTLDGCAVWRHGDVAGRLDKVNDLNHFLNMG